jgi:hypothetical protein
MPEDKRPKPTIDIPAESAIRQASRPVLPGAQPGSAKEKDSPKREQAGTGFFGYLLAGLFGAAIVGGTFYVAWKQYIPGFSLVEPHLQRQLKDLQERMAALESASRSSRPSGGGGYPTVSQGPEGLNEVRSRLDGMVTAGRDLDRSVQTLGGSVQSLAQKVQSMERDGPGKPNAAIESEIAAKIEPVVKRLASAEREIEALLKAQIERQADAKTAALTLALTNLKRAISDGRPFAGELAAVETMSPAKLPVSQLSVYKDEGVSSIAGLRDEFANASQRTIEKHYSRKADGFMGEVLSRAKSAIQIKPADGTGGSMEAILGRMNAALKAGDLKDALVQGAALEDPPQEMRDWFGKAQARVAADEALRKTDQELLANLTRAATRRP